MASVKKMGEREDPLKKKKVREGKYLADFQYIENGYTIIEDVKSIATMTPLYKWKKKMLLSQYQDKDNWVFREYI